MHMANFKRRKPDTHTWRDCCKAKRMQGNSPLRPTIHDKRQPQFYPEQEVDWSDPDMNDYSQGSLSFYLERAYS
jgi:hypothetical protein